MTARSAAPEPRPGLWSAACCDRARDSTGRWQVKLTDRGRKRDARVHVLVAEAFCNGPIPGLVVCHADGDHNNNLAGNLRYASRAANNEDARRHGTMAVGERHPAAKLSEAQVREIFSLTERGARRAALARLFSVSTTTIGKILAGRKWRHLQEAA
jgi:hypothetical protein